MNKNLDMTTGSPLKLLLLFTLPICLNYILQQLFSFIDSVIVALSLGDIAVTGISMSGSATGLVTCLSMGLAQGFGVILSHFIGAKDENTMRKSIATSILLTIIVCTILTFVGIIFADDLLVILETDVLYFNYAYDYVITVFVGLIFLTFYNLASRFLFAVGDGITPIIILVICVVLNTLLDSLLFFVDWGVAWAGWATVIAYAVAGLVGFILLFKRFPKLRICRNDFHVSLGFAMKHLSIGIPMALQLSVTHIGLMIEQRAFNLFPPQFAMARMAGAKIVNIIQGGILNASGTAIVTFYGQNYGAKKYNRLRKSTKPIIIYGVIIVGISMFLSFTLFPLLLPLLLPQATDEIVKSAFIYLAVHMGCAILVEPIYIFRNAIQSLGKSTMASLGGVIETIIRILISLILAKSSYLFACLISPSAWFGASIYYIVLYCLVMKRLNKSYTAS